MSIRVLSLYEGFFAGGARILHTHVIRSLHALGQRHSVLSIASTARREGTVQRMEADARYQALAAIGVPVHTLGRVAGAQPPTPESYSDDELEIAARAVQEADVVLSLKEQPVGVLRALRDRGMMPDVPVLVCLHRSDPRHSGEALEVLVDATRDGLVTDVISCAETTELAYLKAGVEPRRRVVIPNGIDLALFRPGDAAERAATRAALGVPDGDRVVIFAARFDPMKDPGLFLRAVAAHQELDDRTRYVMCGAGMTRDNPAFAELLDGSGIRDHDRLLALGIRDDMPALYRIADVVSLTSSFGEASPLCLLEGIASGAVPVTTPVGDAPREAAGVGYVTAHDPADIAAHWQRALDRAAEPHPLLPAERERIGSRRMIEAYRDAITTAFAAS
ncbi:glycosyltransferase [Microbacterium marinilacus]|uniref:Glycosyltransferase n=1 Tax=Microbacterium marinilacus TaxID=415209 RepID=A0ABP7B7W2_9MICO|nr:glycosyltransferase [Microbacterium marinilacus]MBY0687323.1 glycosyltransferase [Microbacterium marinilacus]